MGTGKIKKGQEEELDRHETSKHYKTDSKERLKREDKRGASRNLAQYIIGGEIYIMARHAR